MNKLKQLYIDEMLDLFSIEVASSRLSESFFETYYDKTKPFQDLFNDTYKVFEINSSIQKKNHKIINHLYNIFQDEAINYNQQINELMDIYIKLFDSNILEFNGNRVIFNENKIIVNETTNKEFTMRKDQNITKFFKNYFKTMELEEEKITILNNNLDRISEFIKDDFKTLYLRIGIEPKDYFRMGQWGYYNESIRSSCTFIYPLNKINYRNLLNDLGDYRKAIITYMQLPTFVATLYEDKESAENREYTAIGRQIFYYDDKLKSLLGLRGYGDSNDVQTIRESVAKIMSTYNKGNYNDYLLENRIESKSRKNIFPKSFRTFQLNILKNNDLDTSYISSVGYLDSIHYDSYAKHVLIYNMPKQQSLFDLVNNQEDNTLEKLEAKEIKEETINLFKSFFASTNPDASINYVHPILYPLDTDEESREDNLFLSEYDITPYYLFLNSKLLNDPKNYYENDRDKTHLFLQEFYNEKYNNNLKIDFANLFFTEEWLDIIEEKTNINLRDIVSKDDIINQNNRNDERER